MNDSITPLKSCVFFDRDGIVNRHPGPGYVERVEDFHLLPEFVDALRVVHEKGYEATIVSNQRGVARGRLTQETLDRIHDKLLTALRAEGLDLLDIFVCTSEDDANPNRKPNPGMLLEAAREHHLDLKKSWMVGDDERDAIAGRRAGCKTVLVTAGDAPTVADHRVSSMAELPDLLRVLLDRVH